MITKLFDTGFACDGTLYTYVDDVLVYPLTTFFCAFFCSFFVPDHESKEHTGSTYSNLGILDKRDFKNST